MSISIKDPPETHFEPDDDARGPAPSRTARRERPWWRHPSWLGLLSFLTVLWVAYFVLSAYLTLDPSMAQVPLRPDVWFHYPVMIFHIAASTVALFTALLQMSSRLRMQHPKAHRISGRIFVFGGVIPAALAAATLIGINVQGAPKTAGLSLTVGNASWAILWFTTAILGYRYARQRRFIDHRRMMIYAFALTTALLWTRPFAVVAFTVPGFELAWFAQNVTWVPWVAHLIIAQWWLNKTSRRPVELPASVSSA